MSETPVAPLDPFFMSRCPYKIGDSESVCKPGQALSRKGSLFQGMGPYLKERVPLGTSLTFWVPPFFISFG